jgi:hypothetical protein
MLKPILLGSLTLLLGFLIVPQEAHAMSGRELRDACEYDPDGDLEEAKKAMICVHYIAGVADTLGFFQGNGSIPKGACIPEETSIGELQDIALDYLKRNPKELEYIASSLVLYAWVEAFPCPVSK